jgi:hypothetical protein
MSNLARSAAAPVPAALRAPAAGTARTAQPRLAVVPAPRSRASSGAFALFVGAVLTAGLLGLLAVNTLLAQGAFKTSDLARRQAALSIQADALQQQVAVLESPQVLAVAAHNLGMVGTKNPVFLDPRTGKILGVPLAGAYPAAPAGSPVAAGAPGAGVTAAKPGTVSPTATKTTATKTTASKPSTKPSPGATKPGGH